jgi:hypothetical protein
MKEFLFIGKDYYCQFRKFSFYPGVAIEIESVTAALSSSVVGGARLL